HPGTGVGLNNHDAVTLRGAGIAQVRFAITQPATGDGFGIDDVRYSITGTTREITQTLGDADFFGFGSGTIGDKAPAFDFDRRSGNDPAFTDHDARLPNSHRPQGTNDLSWTHDLRQELGAGTPVSGTITLAIGGIEDGSPLVGSIDDRLFVEGIEVPGAFDQV